MESYGRIFTLFVFLFWNGTVLDGFSQKKPSEPENFPINPQLAEEYFYEAKTASEKDNGRLWGVPLYGPMLFVDPGTRFVVANRQNNAAGLTNVENVYQGWLPDTVGIANMATRWDGRLWTMVIWQALSKDKRDRIRLMMHELWHRIQDGIGFPATTSGNDHLNKMNGRFLLKMEWRALSKALLSTGKNRRSAIEDGLLFRELRRQHFPGSDSMENRFEMHEGLAAYTGWRLCGLAGDSLKVRLAEAAVGAEDAGSFMYNFAYISGPLYGILLDDLDINWRDTITPLGDLGQILMTATGLDLPDDPETKAKERFEEYDGLRLLETEQAHERTQREEKEKYLEMFTGSTVLVLPNANMKISYDPNKVFSLDSLGTVYKTMTAIADWGKLTVTDAALRSPDWMEIRIPFAPFPDLNLSTFNGNGWQLELNEEWEIVKTDREDRFNVVRKPADSVK